MSIEPYSPATSGDSVWIGQYIAVLRRRKWTIILFAVLGLVGGYAFTKALTPAYESTARVQATAGLSINGSSNVDVGTEQGFVTSDAVVKCAQLLLSNEDFIASPTDADVDPSVICSQENLASTEMLPGLTKGLTVAPLGQSTILTIMYSDRSPRLAQAKAQAFADAYVQIRTDNAEDQLARLRAPIEAEKQKVDKQVKSLDAKINDIIGQDPASKDSLAINNQRLANLYQQRAARVSQQNSLDTQLLELDQSKINPPLLLLPAPRPQQPVSPDLLLNMAIGLAVGLLLGTLLAFLRERLDDSLRGRHDLEVYGSAPVLAVIPKVPGWGRRDDPKLVVRDQPRGAATEAFRTLQAGVSFLAASQGLKVVMITSPGVGEGKSFTAANLALVLADAGRRVVLVSADLRRPRLHRFFEGIDNTVGLSSVLGGQSEPWEAIQDPGIENLRVLVSGPVPRQPSELLQSAAMEEVVSGLREVADFVVIDTPPVLPVADALSLSRAVDGCLIVADAQHTTRGAVTHAREQLDQVNVTVVGSVLNNFDSSKGKAYRNYGYYPAFGYPFGSSGSTNGRGSENGETRRRQPTLGAPEDTRP